ncbi:hypothetical protein QEN19_002997 [Hanseniaspora menglaensis]
MGKKNGLQVSAKAKNLSNKSARKVDIKKKTDMNSQLSKMKRKQTKLKIQEMNEDIKIDSSKIENIHDMMKKYDYTKKNKINTSNLVAQTSLPSGQQIEKVCAIDLKVKKETKELKEKSEKELEDQLNFITGFKI